MKVLASLVTLAGLLLTLTACGGIPVHGKVLTGDVQRVIRVSNSDPRLKNDGLEGITVTLIQGGTQGRALYVLGESVTGPDGSFEMTLSSDNLRAGRILVRAEAESIFRVQNLVDFPREGESLLAQVIERSAPSGDTPKEEPE